ncbi:LapA family protein [Marinobacter sp. M1N3S26]|uniref:LapA family protein n=1 Tax=unclassified Marinobacter TaxID=83889 RepID=UPI00387B7B73
MAGFQKIILLLVVILVAIAVLVFSMNNQMAVSLNFLFFETRPHGVAVWVILGFTFGILLGVVLTLLATVRVSVSRRQLRKRLDKAERALEQNRTPDDRAL